LADRYTLSDETREFIDVAEGSVFGVQWLLDSSTSA
jgi:hypothetical protein